jgi:membrane protein DedA with SNARE-associated domain
METFFIHYLTINRFLGYGLIYFGLIFEGDVFLFATAFLTKLKFFDFFDMLFIATAGILSGDFFWYGLGRWLGGKSERLRHWAGRLGPGIEASLQRNFFRTLLISKFAYGTHHLLLVKIGLSRYSLRRFFIKDIPASLIWIAVVGSLGYIFAASFSLVTRYFRYFEVGVLLAVIIFFLVSRLLARRLKKEINGTSLSDKNY